MHPSDHEPAVPDLSEASVEPGERAGLSPEQDGRLRTLSALSAFGELAPELRALKQEFRARDLRATVRPPGDVAVTRVDGDPRPA